MIRHMKATLHTTVLLQGQVAPRVGKYIPGYNLQGIVIKESKYYLPRYHVSYSS